MPDFDFDAFNHDTPYEGDDNSAGAINTPIIEETSTTETPAIAAVVSVDEIKTENTVPTDNGSSIEVDKW
jgi:hypothetical protein